MSVDCRGIFIQIAMDLMDARLDVRRPQPDYAANMFSVALRCEELARATAINMTIEKVHGDHTQENA